MGDFSLRFKKAREILGISQQELAKKLGVSQKSVSFWEKGRNEPQASIIRTFCNIYGINPTWLLTGKGEMFLSDEPKLIGINNSIVGQAGHNINGTVHIQTLTNNSSAPKTPNDEKNIQELIETFKQLPPELQDYYLNLMKAELSKYKYVQKKFSQG